MEFWKFAFENGVSIDIIKQAVKTESNPFGEITPEQFKEICGQDF